MDRQCYITQQQPASISPEFMLVFFGVFFAVVIWSAEKILGRLDAIANKHSACIINLVNSDDETPVDEEEEEASEEETTEESEPTAQSNEQETNPANEN
jgi:hypothetical protein